MNLRPEPSASAVAGPPPLRTVFWLALLSILTFAAGLGLRDPWPPDEPRFALAARDMAETGRWLFPRVGGELYADKPPLFMWLQAVAYALTGSLRSAFLLPTILASTGVVLLVHDLGCRLWDRRTGLAAALVLYALVQFQVQARSAQIDATLLCLTTLSLYGLCRHLLDGPDWRWYWGGCAAAGLGVITKGVGFLPLLVLLPWTLAAWRGWNVTAARGGWRWAGGGLAFLAAVGVWLVPMLVAVALSDDPALAAYRDEILFHQTATRYADAWGHLKPPWYFLLQVIPWAWLPVSAVLPWLVPRWWRALATRDARVLLLAVWVVLVVIFFSASTGKRGVYLLPTAPAVALLAAPWAVGLAARAGVRRVLFALIAVFTAAVGWLAIHPPRRMAEALAGAGMEQSWVLAGGLMAVGLAVLVVFGVRRAAFGWVALCFAVAQILGWVGHPLANPVRSGRPLVESLEARLPPDTELGLVSWKEQFLLYLDRPVVHFGHRRAPDEALADAMGWLAADPARVVLVNEDPPGCVRLESAARVGYAHRNTWYLAKLDDIDPSCAGPDAGTPVTYSPPRSTRRQRRACFGGAASCHARGGDSVDVTLRC